MNDEKVEPSFKTFPICDCRFDHCHKWKKDFEAKLIAKIKNCEGWIRRAIPEDYVSVKLLEREIKIYKEILG